MIVFVPTSKKSQNRLRSVRAFWLAGVVALLVWAPVTVQTAPLKLIAWPWNAIGDMPEGLTNITAIAAGEIDNLFLMADGSVRHSWGWNFPSKPDLNDAIAVSTTANNALALRSNGTVVGWGHDYFGETIVPPNLTGVVAIATGYRQGVALNGDGTVAMWGQHGTEVPTYVQNIVAISAGKAENYFHALGLKSDGTVVAWGRNDYGEGNVPAGLTNVIAISAGYFHNLALKADGTVVGWGGKDAQIITPPPGLSNVVAISAAAWHNVALKSDGTIATWNGQDVPEWWDDYSAPALTNVVAISAIRFYTLGLIAEQAPVIAMQPQTFTVPWNTPTGNEIKVIGTEPLFYQWRKDGVDIPSATNRFLGFGPVDFDDTAVYTVYVSNHLGSVTSDPATMTVTPWIDFLQHPVSQSVYAGDDVTFFVTAVGSPHTYQWRRNGFDIPGATGEALYLTNVQTEAGTYSVLIRSHGLEVISSNAVLTIDGNVLPAIVDSPRPEKSFIGAKLVMLVTASGKPPLFYQWQKDGADLVGETNTSLSFSSVQSSDTGMYTVRVSNSEGSAISPGAPLTLIERNIVLPPPGTVVSVGGPIVPPGLDDVVAIAAGARHGLALKNDSTVVMWGGESYPPFPGLPANDVPAGLSNVVAIAAGNGHNVALKVDGTVIGWPGAPGGSRKPEVPPNLYGVVAVAAGDSHALAVRADGTVVSWGNVPLPLNGLNNVVSAAAGGQGNIALREDGTVLAWGQNVYPHVFAALGGVTAIAAGDRHIMALQDDGEVFDYFNGGSDPTNSAPGNLSGAVKIAAGAHHSVALNADGSAVGWNGANLPAGLSNVMAISAGRGFTLLLTTNPPAPALALEKVDDAVLLSAPISVSGYVLETTDDLSQPYQPIEGSTSPGVAAGGEKSALTLPASRQKFYRFRKL